jgi:IS1 family transposase
MVDYSSDGVCVDDPADKKRLKVPCVGLPNYQLGCNERCVHVGTARSREDSSGRSSPARQFAGHHLIETLHDGIVPMSRVSHKKTGEHSSRYGAGNVAIVSYVHGRDSGNPVLGVDHERTRPHAILSVKSHPGTVLDNGHFGHFAGVETAQDGYVFILGLALFTLGSALFKFSFYLSDAPYGTHTWASRLLYVGVGIAATLCISVAVCCVVISVTQKLLDLRSFMYYTKYMANVLSTDKQIGIIGALCEGSSIRSIERTTGVHRDTIMRLGVKVGKGCTALMDAKMRNLDCRRLEMDEIWGYVGKKEKHVRPGDDPQLGNVWTFCAIDADTKLVPTFRVGGDRDAKTATAFMLDVADRMKNRVQISTDGLAAYVEAIDWAFGRNVDYGQIIKVYGTEESVEAQRRYSAPKITSSEKKAVFGRPDFDLISTSYVERLNATTRLHMKRLARLTYAFSKKRENFEAAVGLHFAYYNFVKRHNTIRCTPAMAAGVEQSFWSVGELLEAAA